MFPVDNTKMMRGWDIPFFNYVKIKLSMWVSCSFKTALDYSSLYRSMHFFFFFFHFWCHDTTLRKMLSIKKLNLTWNKQTKFRPLHKIFRIFLNCDGQQIQAHPQCFILLAIESSEKSWFLKCTKEQTSKCWWIFPNIASVIRYD